MAIISNPKIVASTIPPFKISVPVIVASGYVPEGIEEVTYKFDLERHVESLVTLKTDTALSTVIPEHLAADLSSTIISDDTVKSDTKRNTIVIVTIKADAERETRDTTDIPVVLSVDVAKTVVAIDKVSVGTMRKATVKATLKADLIRAIKENKDIIISLAVDTYLSILNDVKYNYSTTRRIPHDTTFYKPQTDKIDPAMVWIKQNPKQAPVSIEISLNELALSDTFSLTTTQEVDINEIIAGTIIDYKYQYQIGDVDWKDLTRTCGGMYDCDEIMYRPITYFIYKVDGVANVTKGKLSVHAGKIASALGRKLVFLCDDFKHSSYWTGNGNTYQSIVSTLFGWSSSIPHMMINVFLRAKDNALYVIQRGRELSVVDISNTKHTRPHYKREMERTLWSLGKDSDSNTDSLQGNGKKASASYSVTTEDDEVTAEYEEVASGQQGSAQTLLKKEETQDTVTTYEYTGGPDEGGYRLWRKCTTNKYDYSHVDTTYEYTQLITGGSWILVVEREQSLTKDNIELFRRETLHHPLGNGGQITEVLEGVWGHMQLISSSLSEGVGGSNAYRAAQETYDLTGSTGPKPDDDDSDDGDDDDSSSDSGSTIAYVSNYDSTIDYNVVPTENEKVLKRYTKAIQWLNRKIKETVEMDIYEYNHVVDFTERVRFKGNEYYLSSNTISQTTRELKQSIKLVRWY